MSTRTCMSKIIWCCVSWSEKHCEKLSSNDWPCPRLKHSHNGSHYCSTQLDRLHLQSQLMPWFSWLWMTTNRSPFSTVLRLPIPEGSKRFCFFHFVLNYYQVKEFKFCFQYLMNPNPGRTGLFLFFVQFVLRRKKKLKTFSITTVFHHVWVFRSG